MWFEDFIRESNSLNVCNRVNTSTHDRSISSLLVRQIRDFLSSVPYGGRCHANRKSNVAAYNLARLDLFYPT